MPVEHGQTGGRHKDPVGAGEDPSPLDRSWIGVSMLLVWLAVLCMVVAQDLPGGVLRQTACAVVTVAAGALVGLAVFLPARPSGLRARATVYAVPVLVLTLLTALTRQEYPAALSLAFLPAWALVTALYGVRGGLSTGLRAVCTYVAVGAAGTGLGAVAFFLMLALVFAELPGTVVLPWALPLLQLFLLRRPQHRRRNAAVGVELALAALLVLYGIISMFAGRGPGFAGMIAMLAYVAAVFPTWALVALGRADRSETAEYPIRNEPHLSAPHT